MIPRSVRYRYHKRKPFGTPRAGSHNPMKGATMRLSSLALLLGGGLVLSLALLVGVGSAHPSANAKGGLTIATVNNGDMIVMQSLTSNFTKKYGITVKYVTLPE